MAKQQGRLTPEQEARLKELNDKCAQCLERRRAAFDVIDLKRCMICSVGIEVHQLDADDIDGHNSGRYEKYFTA